MSSELFFGSIYSQQIFQKISIKRTVQSKKCRSKHLIVLFLLNDLVWIPFPRIPYDMYELWCCGSICHQVLFRLAPFTYNHPPKPLYKPPFLIKNFAVILSFRQYLSKIWSSFNSDQSNQNFINSQPFLNNYEYEFLVKKSLPILIKATKILSIANHFWIIMNYEILVKKSLPMINDHTIVRQSAG